MIKLDRLLNVLGGYGARLAGMPSARDVELRTVAMNDPTEAGPPTGDVFLAVGVSSVVVAVELGVEAHATVVLARDHNEPVGETTALATDKDLALLLVDPEVSWSEICEVVYGLVFEGRETESGRGPTDLFTLADTVAATVGGPVTIEDSRSHVMAYSSVQRDADPARHETILGRRAPEAIRQLFEHRGVFRHLATSDAPMFVSPSPEHGLRGRMVVAVRAGRELLGSLWVTCDEPLSSHGAQALAESAYTVALHLLRSRVSADLERQVESELVIALVEGTPDAIAAVGKLGLPPRRFRVIALQAQADGEYHAATLLAFERATTGFGWARPSRSTVFGNTVYTILPCGDDPAPARQWLDNLVAGLPPHVTTAVGIGATATLHELPSSRQEADESLALHATCLQRPAVSYDESWDEILLQRLRTAAAAGRTPTRSPLAELARHDATANTEYVATLRAWLEAQGDLSRAAANLDVHPNTLRYRLSKMRTITDLCLDDPRKRLAMLIRLAIDADHAPKQ